MRELERDFPATTTQHPAPARAPSRLAIVGYGRAGGAIGRAASAAGLVVSAGRGSIRAAMPDADAALICVPDAAIEAAAREEMQRHAAAAWSATSVAPPALPHWRRAATGATFVMHPLQTLPDAVRSRGRALRRRRLERRRHRGSFRAGHEPRHGAIRARRRVAQRYHAAACIASNFLVALEESAASCSPLPASRTRAQPLPLVLRTAGNWSERGPAALTGPIARGDEATVERHLEALANMRRSCCPCTKRWPSARVDCWAGGPAR